MDIYSTCG